MRNALLSLAMLGAADSAIGKAKDAAAAVLDDAQHREPVNEKATDAAREKYEAAKREADAAQKAADDAAEKAKDAKKKAQDAIAAAEKAADDIPDSYGSSKTKRGEEVDKIKNRMNQIAFGPPPRGDTVATLTVAGKLAATLEGTGETIGNVVNLTLRDLTTRTLSVGIPPTVLSSVSGTCQPYFVFHPFTTPFSAEPAKELATIVQWTTWVFTSTRANNPVTRTDLANRVNAQVGTTATPEQRAQIDRGIDQIWAAVQLTGAKAKVL